MGSGTAMRTFETADDRYAFYAGNVRQAARRVARNYPGVDWQDVFQDVMLEVHQGRFDYVPDEWLWKSYYRRANHHSLRYRTGDLNRQAQYCYRPSDVRSALESGILGESRDSVWLPEDYYFEHADDMELNRTIFFVDLDTAIRTLSVQERGAIRMRYIYGGDVDRKILNRAVAHLAEAANVLNIHRQHEGPGARTAISNAQAERLTRT